MPILPLSQVLEDMYVGADLVAQGVCTTHRCKPWEGVTDASVAPGDGTAPITDRTMAASGHCLITERAAYMHAAGGDWAAVHRVADIMA